MLLRRLKYNNLNELKESDRRTFARGVNDAIAAVGDAYSGFSAESQKACVDLLIDKLKKLPEPNTTMGNRLAEDIKSQQPATVDDFIVRLTTKVTALRGHHQRHPDRLRRQSRRQQTTPREF